MGTWERVLRSNSADINTGKNRDTGEHEPAPPNCYCHTHFKEHTNKDGNRDQFTDTNPDPHPNEDPCTKYGNFYKVAGVNADQFANGDDPRAHIADTLADTGHPASGNGDARQDSRRW